MAEASGGRTHQRQDCLPLAGFEDRDDHRTACASASKNQKGHGLEQSPAADWICIPSQPVEIRAIRGRFFPFAPLPQFTSAET